jgi:hypothetical protein
VTRWTLEPAASPGPRTSRYTVTTGGRPATFDDVISGLRGDPALGDALSRCVAGAPYAAVRWETPGVAAATASSPFEFVLVESRELLVPADPVPFRERFAGAVDGVVTFANLSGDATLVVPTPVGPLTAYPHLAAFTRHAPEAQQRALWRAVGEAMRARVGARKVWLSTAGAGVAWLHVRLDDRPKYYAHRPYRSP